MAYATKGGPRITGQQQTRIDCDQCGPAVAIIRGTNEQEIEDACRKHANDKHGGIDSGY